MYARQATWVSRRQTQDPRNMQKMEKEPLNPISLIYKSVNIVNVETDAVKMVQSQNPILCP